MAHEDEIIKLVIRETVIKLRTRERKDKAVRGNKEKTLNIKKKLNDELKIDLKVKLNKPNKTLKPELKSLEEMK